MGDSSQGLPRSPTGADTSQSAVRFSVRELVSGSDMRPTDGWRLAGVLSRERTRLGTGAHTSILGERSGRPGYQKEVAVSWKEQRPLGKVEVYGRLDGLLSTPEGVIIEELKTTALASSQVAVLDPDPGHSEQCTFYCAMLEQNGTRVRGGVLLYYSLVDGGITRLPVDYEPARGIVELRARVDGRLQSRREAARRRALLASVGNALRFPYRDARDAQQEMISQVEEAALGGRFFFCSAPTGTGKTAGALFPLLRQALIQDRRLFFVTARLSQQALALETAQALSEVGGPLLAVQLQAKERSCPMPELRCVPGVCPYLTGFAERLADSGICDEPGERGAFSGDEVTRRSLEARLCPYEVSLALARRSPLLICDLNYVFDSRYHLRSLLEEPDRGRPLLVVDEAHNLPERARGYFSAELSLSQLRDLAMETGRGPEGVGQPSLFAKERDETLARLSHLFFDICDSFEGRLRHLVEERDATYFVEPVPREEIELFAEELEVLLPEAMAAFASGRWRTIAPQHGRSARRDPLLTFLFDLQHFFRLALMRKEEFAVVWFADGLVRVYCLQAGPFVRRELVRFHSAVFMSATMTPFDYVMDGIGLAASEALTLELDSPFPAENRALLFVPGFDTRLRQRSLSSERVATLMLDLMELRRGNYLAYFSSFAYRDEVVRFLGRGDVTVLVQSAAMRTEPLMEKLRANTGGRILLLAAVHGGVFAEGVDFPGHLALGAFVVGPGLPAVTVERELMRAFLAESGGDGRIRAYVQPAMLRSVQAGGRVIRSETDRGFVVLLDDRFSREDYLAQMPTYWRRELVETADPQAVLRDFWARGEGS